MKNWYKVLGIIAAVAIIGFSMAACDNGTGPDSTDTGAPPETSFSVSGTFDKGGGKIVSFELRDAATNGGRSAARAVNADSYAISGELEDEDFLIRLSGAYDPVNLSYTASAASNNLGIRYTINGAFDSNGDSLGSSATLAVKDGENWNTVNFAITEEAVTITATTASTEESGGIPAFAQGWWTYSDSWTEPDGRTYKYYADLILTQWSMKIDDVNTDPSGLESPSNMQVTIISVSGNNSYDVVCAYPVYLPTSVEQAKNAVDQFFSGIGITLPYVEGGVEDSEIWNRAPSGAFYTVSPNDYSIEWCNFSTAQVDLMNLMDQFYHTNALEKYLIDQGVAPTTKFMKLKLAFSNSNSRMTLNAYGTFHSDEWDTWYYPEFDTLAEAQAVTTFDPDGRVLFRK